MKRSTGIILALLLLAFALRVWNLAAQSIWWDEAFTWQTTSHGLANFWQMLLTGDRNPPLYFASVAAWGSIAGWSEFSLRLVSVVWSMAGLAFLFNLAKRLYNTSAGLWTLALAAIAPALVVYAQEARMYAAFFALAAATLYFAWRAFEGGDRKSMVGLLVCEAGLLLTHYFAIPLVITLNLFALLVLLKDRARPAAYAKWIGGQILAALPIAIWTLIVFTTPGSLIKAQEAPPDVFAFIGQVVTLWLSGVRDLQGSLIVLPWLAFLILPVTLIGAWLVNRRNTMWVIAFVGVSLAAAYLMTLVLTSFHPRYVLPYSVPVLVLLGAALSNLSTQALTAGKRKRIARGSVGMAIAVLLLIAIGAGWAAANAPSSAKDDARGVAAYLKQNATADDVILVEANDYTLDYYDHGPAQTKMITATNDVEALQQLKNAVGDAKQVWLPHWNISTQDPRSYWPFLLEQSGQLTNWKSFQGYEVQGYEMHTPLHEPILTEPNDSAVHVARRISLTDAAHPDGALAVAIEWQLPMKYYDPVRVSLRLVDATGQRISSVDRPLLNELGQTTEQWHISQSVVNYYILPVPPFSPPGTYTVTGTLYNGRDVLAEDFLGTIQEPRYLYTGFYDPYRSLAGYKWETPLRVADSDLMLERYAISQNSPQPLEQINILLIWLKPREFNDTEFIAPRLRLVQNGRVWSEVDSNLLTQRYPVNQWAMGEATLDRLQVTYPPVRGPIDLQIGQDDHWTTLTTLQLDESQMMFDPPSMQHTQSAQFDDFAELLGYDLQSDSLSATHPLDLDLYWRATNTEPITTPYTIFTQILAPDGHLVAQDDAPPDPPTTQWVPGQIVPNGHSIKVVDPAYRGPATLIAGWYNSATIERVPVNSGGDYVTLTAPVRVESP
ncbi:MAG TPA: glycosyltransferase family 39 protein [Anaerolineae bacterium]|nr:glycosyltransferase family 39 protein [Anaerolineae bacterium]